MARELNSAAAATPDEYVQRLYKLIPAEISGAYVAISSLINPISTSSDIYLLISFLVLLVALPFYMVVVQSVHNRLQIAVSTISFPIWAANVSSIQLIEDLHRSLHFTVPSFVFGVLLILWTTLTPLFVR